MKMTNFRGDLTGISAEKEVLITIPCCVGTLKASVSTSRIQSRWRWSQTTRWKRQPFLARGSSGTRGGVALASDLSTSSCLQKSATEPRHSTISQVQSHQECLPMAFARQHSSQRCPVLCRMWSPCPSSRCDPRRMIFQTRGSLYQDTRGSLYLYMSLFKVCSPTNDVPN